MITENGKYLLNIGFMEESMKLYTVFGKAIVEVSMEIEAENMEEALKTANDSGKYIDSFINSDRISSDDPVEWNYVEETNFL